MMKSVKNAANSVNNVCTSANNCLDALTRIFNTVAGAMDRFAALSTLQRYWDVISTIDDNMERQLNEIKDYVNYLECSDNSTISKEFYSKFLEFKIEIDIYEDLRTGLRNWFHDESIERITEELENETISLTDARLFLNSMLARVKPFYEKAIEIEPQMNEIYRLFQREKNRNEYPSPAMEGGCCLLI